MKTDVVTVTGDLVGMDLALEAEERFAAYYGLTGRNALHIRLLTEETISMIHGILDDFSGSFWLESEKTPKGLLCKICLSAEKQINSEQETHMLSVASSGRNENAKGILGRIREMLRRSLQSATAEDDAFLQSVTEVVSGSGAPRAALWSLQSYKADISGQKEAKKEEWDELEKSIIAKLADEVKVWLETGSVTVVIEKLIAG